MRAVITLVSAITDAMAPDGTMARMRARSTLDTLLPFGITVLAVVMAVGYQVFGRWARRQQRTD